MNLATVIVLLVVAALAFMALRYMFRTPSCACDDAGVPRNTRELCSGCALADVCSKGEATPSGKRRRRSSGR